jgi:cytochrome c oxidase subunit 1
MTATLTPPPAEPVPDSPPPFAPGETEEQKRWIRWQLYLGFIGLALGGLTGLLQALERLGYNIYEAVGLDNYYEGLTIHGVALAIVFTFTFANAFLSLTTIRGFERPLVSNALHVGSFVLAATGTVLALIPMLLNEATVLYTFYAPLEANALFYLGAALLVVSTWLVFANQLLTLRAWRADNPGERIPLLAYVSIVTYIMWFIASLGIAVEVLAFLLPWSIGVVENTDPLLTRTLFWFSGHPIVYFWLLPVYVSWYLMVPKRAAGRVWSDPIVRVVFLMFLLFSIPVGLHHQFTDPGVDSGLKFVHGIFTFAVFFPSAVTAFTLLAAFENGGRRRGGKGLLGWIPKLPWGSPFATAQILAMLVFTIGGASGLVNASYTVNRIVHNTAYIPGHFHLTVGTAVALSIMGITYWLVPHLTGKTLFSPKTALIQAWLYFVGVLTFSRGLMGAGLEGQPRRIPSNSIGYGDGTWENFDILAGIGGVMMVTSGLLFFVVVVGTLLNKKPATLEEQSFEISDFTHGADTSPAFLDRLGVWSLIALALIAIAYIPVFITQGLHLVAPGFSNLF